jgi:exodeoxyribonuclease VII large subunit
MSATVPTKYFSLLQLNQSIQKLVRNIDRSFWITAELAQVSQRQHLYLELVQKEGEQIVAKSRATLWKHQLLQLQHKLGDMASQLFKPGLKVLLQVTVEFHEVYGLSLNVQDAEPGYTLGELELKRQQTLEMLKKEGLDVLQKQLMLPKVIQRIAVISSATAAGLDDFLRHLESGPFAFEVVQVHASVQGDKALPELLRALKKVQKHDVQAVVLLRGGGSRLDLEVFNEPALAKAIAYLPLPLLTGLGHQRDETVAGVVAHRSFKTPTAVAEFLLNRLAEVLQWLSNLKCDLQALAQQQVATAEHELYRYKQQLGSASRQLLSQQQQHLARLEAEVNHLPKSKLLQAGQQLNFAEQLITALDPEVVLRRGFSLTLVNGKAAAKTPPPTGSTLTTYTRYWKATAEVSTAQRRKNK